MRLKLNDQCVEVNDTESDPGRTIQWSEIDHVSYRVNGIDLIGDSETRLTLNLVSSYAVNQEIKEAIGKFAQDLGIESDQ
jgi:hypothetical protein